MTGPSEPAGRRPDDTGAVVDVPGGPVREALQAAGYTGAARAGRAWAVRAPDGAPCTLHVLRRAALPAGTDERLARLRTVEHAHLARVATVVEAGGEVAVVLRGPSGTTLRDVLARRGALRAGEAVTIVTGLGHALGALHGAGLTQGSLTPDDVVVDDDGGAHLRPTVRAPDAASSPAGDVRALAALARGVVADGADPADGPSADPSHVPDARRATEVAALAALLDGAASGTAPDAPRTAEELAQRAAVTVTPEPVTVPDLGALAAVAFGRSARPREVVTSSSSPQTDAADGAARGAGREPDGSSGQVARTGQPVEPVAGDAAVRASGPGPGEAAPPRPVRGVVRRPVSEVPRRRVVPPRTADPLEDTLVRARALAAPGRPRRAHVDAGGRRERAAARLRRRRTRTVAAGAAAGVVLVTGTLLVLRPWAPDAGPAGQGRGVEAAGPATAAAPTDATLERDRPDLAARELTERRGAMLAGATASDAVTLAGSPARAADDALVARVAERGVIVSAPPVDVARTTVTASGETAATVDVTYAIGAYTLRAKDGSQTTVPAAAERTDRLALAWTAHGWRVRVVEAG
ncbi:hypothetical protein ACFT5B_12615 [Luteimicrobium sp. NPDC057192]|uniref:hypothetical protein n=1 Tax=Luteimicrobium sp. NPDC057192 TaxID=3346042 RepID=UPI003626E18D